LNYRVLGFRTEYQEQTQNKTKQEIRNMIESIFQMLFEVFFMWILMYPGAGLRWLISRLWKSKKTFKDFLDDSLEANAIAIILFVFLLTILIISIN